MPLNTQNIILEKGDLNMIGTLKQLDGFVKEKLPRITWIHTTVVVRICPT